MPNPADFFACTICTEVIRRVEDGDLELDVSFNTYTATLDLPSGTYRVTAEHFRDETPKLIISQKDASAKFGWRTLYRVEGRYDMILRLRNLGIAQDKRESRKEAESSLSSDQESAHDAAVLKRIMRDLLAEEEV